MTSKDKKRLLNKLKNSILFKLFTTRQSRVISRDINQIKIQRQKKLTKLIKHIRKG